MKEVTGTAGGPSAIFLSFYSNKTPQCQLSLGLPGIRTTFPRLHCVYSHD